MVPAKQAHSEIAEAPVASVVMLNGHCAGSVVTYGHASHAQV